MIDLEKSPRHNINLAKESDYKRNFAEESEDDNSSCSIIYGIADAACDFIGGAMEVIGDGISSVGDGISGILD